MDSATASFQWLRTGDAAFEAMLGAIAQATRSINLETYIFAESPLGLRFLEALVAAGARGAQVRVLVDAFGSISLPERFWAPLRQAGGEVRWFNPLSFERIGFRDHRKLLVCDDQVAFIGGLNIAPEYEGDGVLRGWRDLGLQVGEPLAHELAASFDLMFARADAEHRRFTRLRRSSARQTIVAETGEVLLGGPGRGRNAIKRALQADLATAARVQLVAAYFLPTGRLRRALLRSARRGASVQLVLPAKTDVPLSRLASQNFYQRLFRAGVEVFEYQPQTLHTKLVIVGDACYVGSANLDARSLHLNYELMVRLRQPEVVAEARGVFADHLAHSLRIDPERWRTSRTFWDRLKERWACFLLGRLDPLISGRQSRWLRF